MYSVRIENHYSDGHHSTHIAQVEPPKGDDLNDPDLDEWFSEAVFPHTGDGHGIDSSLGSCLTATIIAASRVEHVGLEYEWID
jgi:hypothetical protein